MVPVHTGFLGIKHPLIQAPMAGVSSPEMAAAVSNAGALGSIAVGAMTPDAARTAIQKTAALTSNPFCVNVFTHTPAQKDPKKEAQWLQTLKPYFDELGQETPTSLKAPYPSFTESKPMLDVLLATKPAVVSFHFGLPTPGQITALKNAGCTLLATATSPEEARQIEAAGIDGVVAQGYEAGGHRGIFTEHDPQVDTLDLLLAIRPATSLPLIAAGGLMTGSDIAKAMEGGAIAAQLGTAFVPCDEALTPPAYKKRLLHAADTETEITTVISGRAARGLKTRFMDIAGGPAPIPQYPIAYDAGKALVKASTEAGSDDFAVFWAGTGAHKSRQMPAAELVKVLMEELHKAQK